MKGRREEGKEGHGIKSITIRKNEKYKKKKRKSKKPERKEEQEAR